MGLMLPTRIDVTLKDGRYGVVLECDPATRLVYLHFGTVTRRVGDHEEEHRFTEWIGCLELKEVVGWDVKGSAVTRLSTLPTRKRPGRPGTLGAVRSSPRRQAATNVDGAGTGTSDTDPRDDDE